MAQILNIRAIREREKMTQQELADKAGLVVSSISKFESGQKNPSITTLLRLSVALEVPVADLFATQSPS